MPFSAEKQTLVDFTSSACCLYASFATDYLRSPTMYSLRHSLDMFKLLDSACVYFSVSCISFSVEHTDGHTRSRHNKQLV